MKRVVPAIKKYQQARVDYLVKANDMVDFIKQNKILQLIYKDEVLAILDDISETLAKMDKPDLNLNKR